MARLCVSYYQQQKALVFRLYNIRMRVLVTVASVCSYLFIYFLITLLKPPTEDYLFQLQANTHPCLHSLASSESFSLIISSTKQAQAGDNKNINKALLRELSDERNMDAEMETIMHQLNCFPLESRDCKQHKIIQRIVNGAATSFALHQIPRAGEETKSRIFSNASKVNDLLFLYQLGARALKELSPSLLAGHVAILDTPQQDAIKQLTEFLSKLTSSSLGPIEKEVQRFLKDLTRARQLEVYFERSIHLLEQRWPYYTRQIALKLYGLKGMVKVLLGLREGLQPSQVISIIYLFEHLSLSVGEFYSSRPTGALQHMEGGFDAIQFYYFLGGAVAVMLLLFSQINIKGKVQKQFRHTFPGRRFKLE